MLLLNGYKTRPTPPPLPLDLDKERWGKGMPGKPLQECLLLLPARGQLVTYATISTYILLCYHIIVFLGWL